jgi:hypothetical protein
LSNFSRVQNNEVDLRPSLFYTPDQLARSSSL